MTSFKFPPPPPPPPKAASSDTQQPHTSQRGGHNRGRGDRGRGRGGGQGRGRGNTSSGGNARGGYGQSCARGDVYSRGGSRGGQQNYGGAGVHSGSSNAAYGQQQYPAFPPSNTPMPAPPISPYVNPFLTSQAQVGGLVQPQVDPNALATAMSFMSTPAGQQSMAAFAYHMAGVGNTAPQYSQPPPPQHAPSTPRYSPTQQAGQKRRFGERNNNAQPQPQPQRTLPQQSSKPPRAKAAVPPPVPSFGFSLPTPPVVRPSTTTKGNKKKGEKKDQKKRKVNLGLTHHPMPDESSDEEDIDEEAAYAKDLKGGGFAFEHKGEQITIRTAAEVIAWIKDRRKNFPTQRRIVMKAEEAATKRMSELEFLRRLHGKTPTAQDIVRDDRPSKTRNGNKENKKKQDDGRRRQEELAALRKKHHESMLQKQAAPTAIDLGLGYNSETESDTESSILSESSVVSSLDDSDESDSASDESDESPEPTSSKVGPRPIKIPPPAPAPSLPQCTRPQGKICPNWEEHGRCRFSNKCKWTHPPKVVERLGLYDMMVEQELVKVDQLALEAIKYLGQHGYLS